MTVWKSEQLPSALQSSVAQRSYIPDLSDDDLRKLAREKLSEALQAIDPTEQPEMTRKLCAEVRDRIDGKPGQALTLDATMTRVTVNASIEFVQPVRDNSIITIENN